MKLIDSFKFKSLMHMKTFKSKSLIHKVLLEKENKRRDDEEKTHLLFHLLFFASPTFPFDYN